MSPPVKLLARGITITLPPLTPHQADALLALLDELQGTLWDAYGNAVLDLDTYPTFDDLDLGDDDRDLDGPDLSDDDLASF